ncbi:hypothetical protein ACFY9F_32585 [Streptomyces sp. NPDC012421]|uniref:hypothetical protein n=1 Tax=Streptomyces sp. NPDC012421 TaxID=3364832 RepID=UPI0036E5F5A3
MTPALPRTVRAVGAAHLLDLALEAATHRLSQRLPVDWLRVHLASEATHYLFPMLAHRLAHRPELPPQWRCQQLLTVNTGEQILGLLDVLPDGGFGPAEVAAAPPPINQPVQRMRRDTGGFLKCGADRPGAG